MDDDLLLGTAPPPPQPAPAEEPADQFGDDLAEYLAAEVATETATTAAAAEQPTENTDENVGDDLTAGIDTDVTASAPTGEVPTLPDGRPITSLNKKQAKAELDKKEYKAWKKAMKAFGGAEGSDDENNADDSKSKPKKDKADKKEKKDKKDKKHKKRDRHDGDEVDALAAELEALAGDGEALEGAKRRRREKVKARQVTMDTEGGNDAFSQDRRRRGSNAANSHSAVTAAKLTKAERERVNFANAQVLVQKMAEARASDTAALNKSKKGSSGPTAAPIARLLLRDEVLNFGRKVDNEVPLVKAGFLAEIAHWILDGASGELAPLDLRDVAYDLLLRFGFKGSMNVTHPNRVVDREDLNAWNGIGKEELENTILGRAVNTSRQHVGETARNRQRAVTLLQRLSKAFSGGDDDDADSDDGRRGRRNATGSAVPSAGPLAVRWPCEKDSSILTPFEYISNATEVFQGKVAQVDPLDPESYLRVPPLRIRKTPIR